MKLSNTLRWVLFLPGMLFYLVISYFILHLSLYFTLRNFISPYPEGPERTLLPVVTCGVMVYSAFCLAPKGKHVAMFLTAIIVFLLYFAVAVIIWSDGKLFGNALYFVNGGWQLFFAVIGIICGIVASIIKHTNTIQKVE